MTVATALFCPVSLSILSILPSHVPNVKQFGTKLTIREGTEFKRSEIFVCNLIYVVTQSLCCAVQCADVWTSLRLRVKIMLHRFVPESLRSRSWNGWFLCPRGKNSSNYFAIEILKWKIGFQFNWHWCVGCVDGKFENPIKKYCDILWKEKWMEFHTALSRYGHFITILTSPHNLNRCQKVNLHFRTYDKHV